MIALDTNILVYARREDPSESDPAALTGERGQGGEGHALADAAGDADGRHSGNIGTKGKGFTVNSSSLSPGV